MHALPGVDLAALLQRFHQQWPRVTIAPAPPEFFVSLITAGDRIPSAAAGRLIGLVRHAAGEAGGTPATP